MVGCHCPVCSSTDPRDSRTRCSLYLQTPDIKILIDTSPELRQQAIREKIDRVDAVLYTHAHADHVMGLDDLRRFCDFREEALPIYGSKKTIERLEHLFDYAFKPSVFSGYVRLVSHVVDSPFSLGDLLITPLPLPHGKGETYGYLFLRNGKKILAYVNDCHEVPPLIKEQIKEVEILIIDGLRDEPHPTHLTIAQAITVGREVKAGQIFLTHLTHQKTHVERTAELPSGVSLAYDGLKLEL